MTLASMTGFARWTGAVEPWRLVWEIKTVNSKGLDLRLRAPPQFDAIEPEARRRIGARLTRGACHATLTAMREAAASDVRVNADILARLVAAVQAVPAQGLAPATLDGLLAVRGVVDVVEADDDEATRAAARQAALAGLDAALDDLVAMRRQEGAALVAVLGQRLDRIAELTRAVDAHPARAPDAIRARLAEQVHAIIATGAGLDPTRLHQEAVMLATRADVREELDRLLAHVAAARDLLAGGGAVGRRLDFLAQEFGREASTLCAKANHPALTALGMELRAEVEQLREQAQNIE